MTILFTAVASYFMIGSLTGLMAYEETKEPGFQEAMVELVKSKAAKEDIRKNGIGPVFIFIGSILAGVFWPITLYSIGSNEH